MKLRPEKCGDCRFWEESSYKKDSIVLGRCCFTPERLIHIGYLYKKNQNSCPAGIKKDELLEKGEYCERKENNEKKDD